MNTQENNVKEELILMRITGEDRPGLTASIMSILAKFDAKIMDIGQADIHNTLSLGILIRVDEHVSGNVMKEVLFKSSELHVNVGFFPVSEEDYNAWVGRQGKNRYILTLLGRRIHAKQIEAVAKIIVEQGLNIDAIKRLSGRPPLESEKMQKTRACVEFSLRGTPKDMDEMHRQLMALSGELEMDSSFQKTSPAMFSNDLGRRISSGDSHP